MRLHCLQHLPYDDATHIAAWAQRGGHVLARTQLDQGQPLPALDSFDGLVILGGFMNVYQYDAHPWLSEEKRFIARAIERGALVLGICLGAQMLSDALGGVVTWNHPAEIGWFPVRLAPGAETSPFLAGLPTEFICLEWHGDQFSIPPGATCLASSDACPNQIIAYGDRVLGVQFHPECTADGIHTLIARSAGRLTPGPTIQSAEQIVARMSLVDTSRELLEKLLDSMAARCERPPPL